MDKPLSLTTKHLLIGPTCPNNSSSCSDVAEYGRFRTNSVRPAKFVSSTSIVFFFVYWKKFCKKHSRNKIWESCRLNSNKLFYKIINAKLFCEIIIFTELWMIVQAKKEVNLIYEYIIINRLT